MKKIIIIKKEDVIDNSITGVEREQVAFTEGCKKIEYVPETFEELKELIKQKVKEDNHNGIKKGFGSIEYILIDDKSFLPTGEILDEDNDVFAVNRTPQQMWQIIKALVEE